MVSLMMLWGIQLTNWSGPGATHLGLREVVPYSDGPTFAPHNISLTQHFPT